MKNNSSRPLHCSNLSNTNKSDKYTKLVKNLEELCVVKRAHKLKEDEFQTIYHDHKDCITFESSCDAKVKRKVRAIVKQKIIIIPKGDINSLKKGQEFDIEFDNKSRTKAQLIRVSEFPNHHSEYNSKTYTALITWQDSCEFGTLTKVNGKDIQASSQLDNISINEGGGAGNRPPGDPIVEGDSSNTTPFPIQNDYRRINPNYRVGAVQPGTPTVAVLDTGSLFLESTYKSSQDDKLRHLPLLKREKTTYPYGFCSITKYLDRDYRVQMSGTKGNTESMGIEEVLTNPFDDAENRHGTTVSAIIANATLNKVKSINDDSCTASILPVKCFDYLGSSTLFDILCAFNYVFSRISADNIRIVNASWGLYVPEENVKLLDIFKKKILALKKENVFVVTSAGNRPDFTSEPHNLKEATMYPACFSSPELDNLITVTTVATVVKEEQITANKYTEILSNFQAIENYSSEFVDIGVVGHSFEGIFSSPFKSKSAHEDMPPAVVSGSSFAAAYVSGYLAELLIDNPSITTKQDFFNSLTGIHTSKSLTSFTRSGRYLLLPEEEYATCSAYVDNYLSTIS